ncbi:MAG: VOC family protein [Chloroflexi bacterium]|nr:VOC family protein [Chloroflexota bacterium]
MGVERLDHIHIYVKDLPGAMKLFSAILGTKFSKVINNPEPLAFDGTLDPLGVELIAATSPTSHIAKSIEKRGEGLSAISLKVTDIEETTRKLEGLGLRVVGRLEKGGLKEVHFHPKDAYGVQIELCQYDDVHGAIVVAESGADRLTTE